MTPSFEIPLAIFTIINIICVSVELCSPCGAQRHTNGESHRVFYIRILKAGEEIADHTTHLYIYIYMYIVFFIY